MKEKKRVDIDGDRNEEVIEENDEKGENIQPVAGSESVCEDKNTPVKSQ